MRKMVVTLAALGTIAVFVAASTAGYNGKASKPSSGTSSIALASVMSGDGTTKLAAANTAIVASAANVTTIFLIGTIPLTRAPRQTAPGLPGFRYRFWIRGFCRAEWIERPR